jgi:anti-sigma-K factor RskA
VSPANHTTPDAGSHPVDALAAFAVDAVEPDERRVIEAHLERCPACRRELAAHQEVLARMIADERPPTGVWDRIVAQTRAPAPAPGDGGAPADGRRLPRPNVEDPHVGERNVDDSLAPRPGVHGRRAAATRPADVVPIAGERPRHLHAGRRAGSRRRLVAALAAAAAVAVAVGVAPRVLDGVTGDDAPPTTDVVAPDLPVGDVVTTDGTTVAHVRADERGSYVEMAAMAPLTDERTYQLWSLDGPEPVSLGLLGTGDESRVRVSLPDGTSSVAISDEPAGGSPAPRGPIAGTGELATPA